MLFKILRELEDIILILHDNEQSQFEFLIPGIILKLREYFTDISRREVLALQSVVGGWGGFGSPGQVLEPLILTTLIDQRCSLFDRNITYEGDLSLTQLRGVSHVQQEVKEAKLLNLERRKALILRRTSQQLFPKQVTVVRI